MDIWVVSFFAVMGEAALDIWYTENGSGNVQVPRDLENEEWSVHQIGKNIETMHGTGQVQGITQNNADSIVSLV
jgi:hypothetical protein